MRSIEELNNTCGAIAQRAVQIGSSDLHSKQELIEEKYDILYNVHRTYDILVDLFNYKYCIHYTVLYIYIRVYNL